MAKYTSGINNLVRKTHNFISHENLCMLRDYYNEIVEEYTKTPDFSRNWEEFVSLDELYGKSKDQSIVERAIILARQEPGILYKERRDRLARYCERRQHGLLLPKYYSDDLIHTIPDARKHFARRQTGA